MVKGSQSYWNQIGEYNLDEPGRPITGEYWSIGGVSDGERTSYFTLKRADV